MVPATTLMTTTTTTTSSSRTITLDDLTAQNIGILKRLNKVLFPVPYSDKFYKESLTVGELAKYGMTDYPFSLSLHCHSHGQELTDE